MNTRGNTAANQFATECKCKPHDKYNTSPVIDLTKRRFPNSVKKELVESGNFPPRAELVCLECIDFYTSYVRKDRMDYESQVSRMLVLIV